ncbi:uncharacterized protein LOC116037199 [Sander lucioperca]|uniref:uncharacterized protein LOC116037199 n=1 Tax=Sander lucioperca TaxID=283035 RepID=UPI001653A473|nr:uncharacterized protein LOC116037199 [Sander lucioperca]
MVPVCAFPNCGNQMKRYLSLSFHRLPLRNREILQLWLVVLQLDVQTPLRTLRERDYRVCSEHFDEDDFTEKSVKSRYLKANAIPKVKRPTADKLEGTTSSDIETELAAVPQSTPKKASSKSGHPASFKIVLSSPQTKTPQQRTKPSLSGIYFALPPLRQQTDQAATASSPSFNAPHTASEYQILSPDLSASASSPSLTVPCTASEDVSQGGTEHSDVLEMSTSLGEMAVQDPSDTSYAISSDTPPSSKESFSDSASASGNGKGWSERKWLVNESKLLELFALCRTCGSAIEDKTIITQSSQIRVQWNCINEHSGTWSSCPDIRGMPASNLIISAATFFTGTTHTTIMDWAELLHTSIPKKTQFYALQSSYLIPVIQEAYQTQHEQIIKRLIEHSNSGQKVELCGDARCDSPGFSAKYCTYSFQDDATKEIVHFEFVQVTEASSSVAMEVLGFQRGLDYLLERGVDIEVITTDRSPSIRKLLRDNYRSIRHELDPWHVSKSVKKKLVSISNKKDNKDLRPWIKAVTNHLYWSCYTSKGDKEDCVRRWTSLLIHICGVHRWEEDSVQYTCGHPTLTKEHQRRKRISGSVPCSYAEVCRETTALWL